MSQLALMLIYMYTFPVLLFNNHDLGNEQVN